MATLTPTAAFHAALMVGDPTAVRFGKLIVDALAALRDRKRWLTGKPPVCVGCQHAFGPEKRVPPAFLIYLPWAWEEADDCLVIVSPVCEACAEQSDEEILATGARYWEGGQVQMVGHA